MRTFPLACALVAVLGGILVAEEPLTQRVKALAARLSSEDPDARDEAERALAELGSAAFADVEAEISLAKDEEARGRLARVLDEWRRIEWKAELADAREAAKTARKPLLIVRCPKNPDAASAWMRHAIDRSTDLRAAIARGWVAAWTGDAGSAAGEHEPGVEGTGAPEFFFFTSDGELRHYLSGWWRDERLAAELARAAIFCAGTRDDALVERAGAVREITQRRNETMHEARKHIPWICGQESCVLERLLLCYASGNDLLGRSAADGLPETGWTGDAGARWRKQVFGEAK